MWNFDISWRNNKARGFTVSHLLNVFWIWPTFWLFSPPYFLSSFDDSTLGGFRHRIRSSFAPKLTKFVSTKKSHSISFAEGDRRRENSILTFSNDTGKLKSRKLSSTSDLWWHFVHCTVLTSVPLNTWSGRMFTISVSFWLIRLAKARFFSSVSSGLVFLLKPRCARMWSWYRYKAKLPLTIR